MIKSVLKNASIGLAFSGIAFLSVKILGFNNTSFVLMLYLYVAMGVAFALIGRIGTWIGESPLSRLVIVSGSEELRFRKILSGEVYRVDGEIEKM